MEHPDHPIEVLSRGVCVVDGLVLLCRTRGAENTYLPGGHVEFREPARRSLERELLEETGRKVVAGKFLGACEHAFHQKGVPHAEINLVFEMEMPGLDSAAEVRPREPHLAFSWAPLHDLAAARLEPAALCARLPAWLSGAAGERWADFEKTC